MEEKDLVIIIECEPSFHDNWMSFASWYSIQKKISDAQVLLTTNFMGNFFGWANRCNVKIYRYQFKIERPIIKRIKPSVMAVREFSDSLDIVSSKTDIPGTFVDYRFGCGNFDLGAWTNSKKPPFDNALKNFSTINLTINEYAILDTWEQCCSAYKQIVGGLV